MARLADPHRGAVRLYYGFTLLVAANNPMVGFGAPVLVGGDMITAMHRGGNKAARFISEFLGGTPFLGFIAAVAFAAILAVVAGLSLAAASALSHDIFLRVVRKDEPIEHEQVKVARLATVIFPCRNLAISDEKIHVYHVVGAE